MQNQLILLSGLMAMASGLPAVLMGQRSNVGQRLSTIVLLLANVLGLVAVYCWWTVGSTDSWLLPSPIAGFRVSLAMDGISAFFLVPILVVTSVGSVFGLQYWKQSEHENNGRRVSFFLERLQVR